MVDRPLRRLPQRRAIAARESSAEDDAGRLRKRLDVLAEEEANELEHGSLARSRTAREDDAAWDMAVVAVAGFHAVRVIVIVTDRLNCLFLHASCVWFPT